MLSSLMPPETSTTARPFTTSTARSTCSTLLLSSRRASAPASSAWRSSASSRTSAWMSCRGPYFSRARRAASPRPPASRAWFSLMSTASKRPQRRWERAHPAQERAGVAAKFGQDAAAHQLALFGQGAEAELRVEQLEQPLDHRQARPPPPPPGGGGGPPRPGGRAGRGG